MNTHLAVFVDSGNSRVKVGWLALPDVARRPERSSGSMQASPPRDATRQDMSHWTSGRYAAVPIEQTAAFDKHDLAGLTAWLAALPRLATRNASGVNVAGNEQGARLSTVMGSAGFELTWHRATLNTGGLANGYDAPEQLGADRWAAMLGARHHNSADAPTVVASFGTATTIDTIGPDGRFLGGLILPGPALMRSALFDNTADLPLADSGTVLFPTHTHAAIASGVAAAQAGAVLRQWTAAASRFDARPVLLVAGGGWAVVADEVVRLFDQCVVPPTVAPQFLPHPVLDGLAVLTQLDRSGAS